jgi:hypothetical protein
MLKNWKSLFVKQEDTDAPDEPEPAETRSNENLTLPTHDAPEKDSTGNTTQHPFKSSNYPAVPEVLKAYETGLDSINMPGYDFYEFYKAIESTGNNSEQAYKMAFQMARTLDKTITPGKFLHDAEFYISKINEVHNDYVRQGQQKLHDIQAKKQGEKGKLINEIDAATKRIAQIRSELTQLESEISTKRSLLNRIDEHTLPQEKSIQDKLQANDHAHMVSIEKLNIVKQCIQRYIAE